jgi:hypothetical protein
MSLVKIQGNASGTGEFTIAAPNSNTNRTLTLPDSSGTLALAGSSLTGVTDSATPFETALGTGAGGSNTGVNNTFVGYNAGTASTTGTNNTAVGYQALDANTTGASNIAMGTNALGANTTGANNVAVGSHAMGTNSTGIRNVAMGHFALYENTTGQYNTAIGYEALNVNTTGANNTAVGYAALDANTTGIENTAVGTESATAITTGQANAAFGYRTLFSCTTGSNNCAIGRRSLPNLTTGSGNVAIGDDTGYGTVFNVTTENTRGLFGHDGITNAYVKVAWTVTSDARDKTSIESISHGLSFVQQLNPVSYRWKTNREDDTPVGNRRYGFLAQEVMALEGDNPIIIDNETPEHLKYQGEALVPVLVKAIQELSAKVTALEAQLATTPATPPAEPNA